MPPYSPFERRLRRAARLALYGALALLAAIGGVLLGWAWIQIQPGSAPWDLPADRASEEVRLLQEYLRIDTSETTGSIPLGAEWIARQLAACGLEPHVERLGERYANVWAVLEGDERPALVLHNHIDVSDPGDAKAWRHPPFAAALDGPFLYGRGAFDMKSIAVAQLLALRDQAQAPERPRRSVIFLATGSEERGSELGAEWVLARHPELAARFWAVLTEGGVVEPVSVEEIKYWGIEFAQKQYAYGWACSLDRERLERFQEDLREWQRFNPRPRLHPSVERFLLAYGPSRDRPTRRLILDRLRRQPLDGVFFANQPSYLRSFFLDEIHTFPAEAEPGGGYRMRLVFHLLPGADLAKVREDLLQPWMTHDLSLTVGPPVGAAVASSLEHEVYRTLETATRAAHHEAEVGPQFLAWSVTDARFFRAAGVPTYGYSPFLFFNLESLRADRANERINVPGYVDGVGLYREVVRQLVR